jgi:hypothetical protein
MSDETITFLILGAAVFVWDNLRLAIVAIGVAVSLWATNVLSLDHSRWPGSGTRPSSSSHRSSS